MFLFYFLLYAAAAAKSLQSCPTLWDPIDGSPPGSSVPGILQARTLEWVAISFSNAWKWKVKVKSLSRAQLLATPWTAAYQAPLSMGFSRQEYWTGLPLPSPWCTLVDEINHYSPDWAITDLRQIGLPYLSHSVYSSQSTKIKATVSGPLSQKQTNKQKNPFFNVSVKKR